MLKISEQSKEKFKNNVVPGEIYLVVDTVALYFSEHTFWLYQQNGEHILILYKYMDSNNDPVAL